MGVALSHRLKFRTTLLAAAMPIDTTGRADLAVPVEGGQTRGTWTVEPSVHTTITGTGLNAKASVNTLPSQSQDQISSPQSARDSEKGVTKAFIPIRG